jgi:hypothetical protein
MLRSASRSVHGSSSTTGLALSSICSRVGTRSCTSRPCCCAAATISSSVPRALQPQSHTDSTAAATANSTARCTRSSSPASNTTPPPAPTPPAASPKASPPRDQALPQALRRPPAVPPPRSHRPAPIHTPPPTAQPHPRPLALDKHRSLLAVGPDRRAPRGRAGPAYRRLPPTVNHGRPETPRLRRTEGTHAVPEVAERCRSMLALADTASPGLCRHFGSARGVRERRRTAMVRKGSPVRVRQRASEPRHSAVFSFPDRLGRPLPGTTEVVSS